MAIEWRKGFNPDVVLDKIDSSKHVKNDKVSFGGFIKHEYSIVIETMLKFPETLPPSNRSALVNHSLFECAKTKITRNSFLKEINARLQTQLAIRPQQFQLLTSLSIVSPFLFSKLKIEGCEVTFLGKSFPKKYKKHRESLVEREDTEQKKIERDYCKVIVTTEARSSFEAAESCLAALNILRAFLCMHVNSSLSISFGNRTFKPLNRVVLGTYHTIHKDSGEIADQCFWFDPHGRGVKAYSIASDQSEKIRGNIQWMLKRLNKLQFKKLMKSSLIRFVNAYDHTDYHSTLITGWGSIEMLATNEKESNRDLIARRCSFLVKESELHRQVIEHIREYRNNYVHYGDGRDDPSAICFQLQRYYHRLIIFYLNNVAYFKDRDEANGFLSLPPDVTRIRREVQKLKRALKFHGPSKD